MELKNQLSCLKETIFSEKSIFDGELENLSKTLVGTFKIFKKL